MVHLHVFVCQRTEKVSSFKMVRNGLHGKEVAAPLHRRAYAGVCTFLVVSVACNKPVLQA